MTTILFSLRQGQDAICRARQRVLVSPEKLGMRQRARKLEMLGSLDPYSNGSRLRDRSRIGGIS